MEKSPDTVKVNIDEQDVFFSIFMGAAVQTLRLTYLVYYRLDQKILGLKVQTRSSYATIHCLCLPKDNWTELDISTGRSTFVTDTSFSQN